MEAGDVIIVVRQRPSKVFERKGADLFYEKEISLLESLTGVEFTITHLDGRTIRIKNKAGEIVKPNDVMTVEEQGMPFHKQSYKFGNLFIKFKIKFPDTLQSAEMDQI